MTLHSLKNTNFKPFGLLTEKFTLFGIRKVAAERLHELPAGFLVCQLKERSGNLGVGRIVLLRACTALQRPTDASWSTSMARKICVVSESNNKDNRNKIRNNMNMNNTSTSTSTSTSTTTTTTTTTR